MEANTTYKGNIRILTLTTIAFFVSFVAWFNMAPFATTIQKVLSLTDQEIKVLAVVNVALTIPARILIGMLVDRFGPRRVYTILLATMSIPCFMFAMGTTFTQLLISRLLLGIIGAGFVVGIRMVSEWFPSKQMGLAEGIYGGWGNFGSQAATFLLPLLAILFLGTVEDGWRFAIALTGVLSLVYSGIYYFSVQDTPAGKEFKKPKRHGAMVVSSYKDLIFLMGMTLPMYVILGVLVWKLNTLNMIRSPIDLNIYLGLLLLYGFNCFKIWDVNRSHLSKTVEAKDQYKFKQVALLDLAYFVTFGAELALVSMLPTFFQKTFSLSVIQAGLIAGNFTLIYFFARPMGGWLCDVLGRRKILLILLAILSVCFFVLSHVDSTWPISAAIVVAMITMLFIKAGEGAVYAIVPLIHKGSTG
ncbi:MAG: MFS transporter, partial [Candidatus Margulisiibacteriota bacterium]